MTDERDEAGARHAGARLVLRHLLCALVALMSFAVSTPLPPRAPAAHVEDLHRSRLAQLDDDEERERLVATVEEEDADDDEGDDPARPG